jgi:hypothetical protein
MHSSARAPKGQKTPCRPRFSLSSLLLIQLRVWLVTGIATILAIQAVEEVQPLFL